MTEAAAVKPLKIDRPLVLRNTLINILSGLAPMVISLLTLPPVIGAIGTERYGMLSLALGAVGYFGILDLGLGSATTKFAAEALGKGDDRELPSIVWTSVFYQLPLGLLGGLILAALAPQFAGSWLKVPAAIHDEVLSSLFVLCLVVPLIFVGSTLLGVLEAGQRFDLSNAIGIPGSAAMALAVYAGARAGFRLPGIVALVVLVRALTTLATIGICLRLYPSLRRTLGITRNSLRRLLSYGVWVSVGGMVYPFLTFSERFFLGRYISLSDVAYFTVPASLMGRLGILPGSLVRTLFPAFSTLGASDPADREDLYLRSSKYLALASGPLFLFLSAFSSDIFTLWLGPEVAAHMAPACRILLYGGAFSMASSVSTSLLLGAGRPDLETKTNAAIAPLNTAAVWWLVRHAGVSGAALGCSLRAAAQGLIMTALGIKTIGITYPSLVRHRLWACLGESLCLFLLMGLAPLAPTLMGRLGAWAGGTFLFLLIGWAAMLDATDRAFIKSQIAVKLRAAAA